MCIATYGNILQPEGFWKLKYVNFQIIQLPNYAK